MIKKKSFHSMPVSDVSDVSVFNSYERQKGGWSKIIRFDLRLFLTHLQHTVLFSGVNCDSRCDLVNLFMLKFALIKAKNA